MRNWPLRSRLGDQSEGVTRTATRPRTGRLGAAGVWNCENGDRIEGCNGYAPRCRLGTNLQLEHSQACSPFLFSCLALSP